VLGISTIREEKTGKTQKLAEKKAGQQEKAKGEDKPAGH
jgi:hypothetical protein